MPELRTAMSMAWLKFHFWRPVNSDSVALIQFATEAVDDGAALSFERSRSAEAGVRCNGYLAYGPDITAALRIISINKSG